MPKYTDLLECYLMNRECYKMSGGDHALGDMEASAKALDDYMEALSPVVGGTATCPACGFVKHGNYLPVNCPTCGEKCELSLVRANAL